MKVKILYDDETLCKYVLKTLKINKRQLEQIRLELAGQLPYEQEFETTAGEIIVSSRIVSIQEIKKWKKLMDLCFVTKWR